MEDGSQRSWRLRPARADDAVRAFYVRHGWREEGPPRVRDRNGARLVEPRYVRDL